MSHLRLLHTETRRPAASKLRFAALLALAAPLAACSGADRSRHQLDLARRLSRAASDRTSRKAGPVSKSSRKCAMARWTTRTQAQVRQFARAIQRPWLRRDRRWRCLKAGATARRRAPPSPVCGGRSPPAAPAASCAHILLSRRRSARSPRRSACPTRRLPRRLDSRCGQWPNDLASGSSLERLGEPAILEFRLRHPADDGGSGRRSARSASAPARRAARFDHARPRHRRRASGQGSRHQPGKRRTPISADRPLAAIGN